MVTLSNMLTEIYAGQDAHEDFVERYDKQLEELAYLLKNSGGRGKLPWNKVSDSKLSRIWLDFGKTGVVRDERGMDDIRESILNNIARLRASTEMMGHTSVDIRPHLDDMGHDFTDEEWDIWMADYFTDVNGAWLLSDYGLPKLEKLYGPLFYAETAEDKLYAVDKILNVIHQRSDLASFFVVGGTSTLLKIANQGGYSGENESKIILGDILTEAYGDIQKKKWKLENPTLNDDIIDGYIKKFNIIRKSKPSESKGNIKGLFLNSLDRFDIGKYENWSEFETFVDYVAGQRSLKKTGGEKLEFDAKPLVHHNGIEVYYADSKHACIKYKGTVPYSWCISRPDSSNMYYTYRFKAHQPAFYFVKNIEKTDSELKYWKGGEFDDQYHFFVLQVTKYATIEDNDSKNYIVTGANNDGDIEMSWGEILVIEPGLKDLKKYFLPKPLTPDEEKTYTKYKEGITDEEFAKLSYDGNDDEREPEYIPGGKKHKTVKPVKVKPVTYKDSPKTDVFGNPIENLPFESIIREGYPLPNDVDVQTEKLSQFIGSLFLPIFKKRIEHGKTKLRGEIVSEHRDYLLAKKYRDDAKNLFSVEHAVNDSTWGKTSLIIHSKNKTLPSIYVKITNGYPMSNSGYVHYDVSVGKKQHKVYLLIDQHHFTEFFEKSIEELEDTIKHEIRHYFQFTKKDNIYVGMPKGDLTKHDRDIFGSKTVGGRTLTLRHHMRDVEFKTNVHTYSFYIKKFLNVTVPKREWKDKFKDMISGKTISARSKIGSQDATILEDYLDNMDHMKKTDKPRWIQFVKEIYKEIFK